MGPYVFAWVFDDDTATGLRLRYHYWPSPEPLEFPNEGSYADPDAPVSEPFEYAWQHSMGEIEPGSGVWWLPEPYDQRLPVLYLLKATKD